MKKIITLKVGDTVPENAKFLYADKKKIKTGRTETDYGIFSQTTYVQYKMVVYFYYEIEESDAT
jgi:hypothetical protein